MDLLLLILAEGGGGVVTKLVILCERHKFCFHRKTKRTLKKSYNQCQKLWEKLLFGQFCISAAFPLLTILRKNEKKLRQAMLWGVQHCIGGEGEF